MPLAQTKDTFENPRIEGCKDYDFLMSEHALYCSEDMDIEVDEGIETARCYTCRFAIAKEVQDDRPKCSRCREGNRAGLGNPARKGEERWKN